MARATSALLVVALWAVGCASGPAPKAAPVAVQAPPGFVQARRIVIVRHGDIDIELKKTQGKAVPLTEAGQARAGDLAASLRDAGVTRIITSETVRTQQTGAPLATLLHVTEENPFSHGVEPGATGPKLSYAERAKSEAHKVKEFLASTARPDDVILVVHHHSIIPSLLAEFGYPGEPEIVEDAEFDRIYVLEPDAAKGTYQLFRLRYGK
jgi:broad specificity phosphatase PhoE